MSGKQQGLRYFQKFLNSKASERNALAKKVLRYVMAVGFVLSPWLGGEAYAGTAEAPGIVRVPGTGLTDTQFLDGTSNVAHIYAEQADITNKVGFNRFQTFNVAAGETANLYFQKEAGGTILNSLVNSVESRISISGTVNAIRNNKIGGNLFFVSPNGMVVGSTGVINAGALTAVAPANLTYLQTLQQAVDGIKPEGSSISGWGALAENGSIVINGKINTATGIDLQAQTVTIENVNSTGSPETYLRTGVVFNDIVNTDFTNVQAYDISQTRLTLTKDEDGKIVITNPITSEAVTSDGAGRINIISRRFSGSDCYGSFTLTDSSIDAIGEFKMEVGAGTSIGSTSSIKANQISIFDNFGNFVNNGTITGSGVVNIAAGHLKYPNTASIINGGTIESTAGTMSLTSKYSVTNNGTIKAKDQIAFTVGGTLTNQGKIQSTSSNVQAHIGRDFKNFAVPNTSDISELTGGIIEAGGNVQVDYNLDTKNTGIGVATEAGTIDGIYNDGLIWAKGAEDPVYDEAGNITSSGSGNIWLTSSYNITNYGTMKANRQITLNARDFLHNYGLIEGVTYLDIKSIMGYVYNHAGGSIIAKGGNIALSSGQANLQIKDDKDGQKKKNYRKFTPIIIEGLVRATSDDDDNNQTKKGDIKITAHLGDIYVVGGTIETKPEVNDGNKVVAEAGDVILDAAQNITIGFNIDSAKADDPTTDGENANKKDEKDYFLPNLQEPSGKNITIFGTNITLKSGSKENNYIRMSNTETGSDTTTGSNTLTASKAVTIDTTSMDITAGTINASTLNATGGLNITGGTVNASNVTAKGALTLTGGSVTSTGDLTISGDKGLTIGSDAGISTGGNLTITSSNGTVTNNKALGVTTGSVSMNGNGGVENNASITAKENVSMTSKAGNIDNSSTVTSTGGSVSMNAGGDVTGGTATATTGSVSMSGGGDVTGGTITGKDVTLTGGSNSTVTASSIVVDKSLQLQGDNISANDVKRIENPSEGTLKVGVSGAGGTNSTAQGNVGINISGNVVFSNVNVSNANVETSGTLQVNKLHVEGNAQFTSNDTTVNVYGQGVTPAPDAPNPIQDKGDGNSSWLTLKIDDTGVQSIFVGEEAKAPNNIQDSAVQLSGKLVDYNPYDTYLEQYGDVADLFGRSDLIQASERPTGETATREEDNKVVLKQDADGLRLEEQKQE